MNNKLKILLIIGFCGVGLAIFQKYSGEKLTDVFLGKQIEKQVGIEKRDDHDGHGHDGHMEEEEEENEGSGLDLSVAEIFEAACEHNIKTHECDECRYEVGVVKASAQLFKGGLLEKSAIEERVVSIPLRLTGEVQFDERRVVNVGSQVGGIIRKVHVTLGDKVTEGQELLEIESVEIGNAKAVYQEALAMEKLARLNHDRIEALHKEGISSEKEIHQARQEYKAAQIRLDVAKGTLKRIGINGSKEHGISLDNSSGELILRAPSNGTVLGMHAVSGEVVKLEESLVTIGDNSSLWVWADLYEKDYARVFSEQNSNPLNAEVSVKAFPDYKFKGKVDFISPAMSEASRTIKVRIAVPNPKGNLLAGMFATVDIFLPGNQQALSLPQTAVLEDDGREFVFMHYKDDYYVRRPIITGNVFEEFVEIKKGLSGNELIVSNGAFLLKSDVLRSKMGAGCAD